MSNRAVIFIFFKILLTAWVLPAIKLVLIVLGLLSYQNVPMMLLTFALALIIHLFIRHNRFTKDELAQLLVKIKQKQEELENESE